MGFVDCDTHVRETDASWAYLTEGQRSYRPATFRVMDQRAGIGLSTGGSDRALEFWVVQDQRTGRNDRSYPYDNAEEYYATFPAGSVTLQDRDARVGWMDKAGVDVHVMYSTFWVGVEVDNPSAEVALAQSWNRWMATATDGARNRLRWALKPPTLDIEAGIKELEFGKDHGAVAVNLHGREHGLFLSDPHFWPLYEKAEELGLAVAVHAGTNSLVSQRFNSPEAVWYAVTAVQTGFVSVLMGGLPKRFPGLRWAFLEAGSQWLPSALTYIGRNNSVGLRSERDPSASDDTVLADNNLFVACQVDEDLPYLLRYGSDNFILGSDWGHLDSASDPDAHQVLASRGDLDPSTVQKLTGENARRLYDLGPNTTLTAGS